MTRVGGIVLCGGQSTRMGRPKALLPVGDEVMLQRVVRMVREVADPVIVVAATGQDVPAVDAEIVRDEVESRGPLAGFVAGMRAMREKVEAVYLSSCDVPFLSAAFVGRVVQALNLTPRPPSLRGKGEQENRPPSSSPPRLGEGPGVGLRPLAAVPQIAGRLHPLAAAYSLAVLPIVSAELAAGRLRMTDLFNLFPTHFLTEADLLDADPHLLSLRNVNTPAEYERAVREFAPPNS